MNDRYGVDPRAATSVSELASLLQRFGPEHGRFIFDFPSGWHTQVKSHLQEAGDLKRAQLTEWLRIAKRSLLPTKARYSPDLNWAQNAAHLLKDAKGLIGLPGSKPPCRALEDVLVDPTALPDCRGKHVPRTARDYADVAKPLLQISPKVVLVDPYFGLRYREKTSGEIRPDRRRRDVLRALIQAAQVERKVEVFKLMVSPDSAMIKEDGGAGFKADYTAILHEVGGSGLEIEYGLLDKRNSLDRHPRYLLGSECGLRFDWGFDTRNDSSTNHIEWIGSAALEPLLKRFT